MSTKIFDNYKRLSGNNLVKNTSMLYLLNIAKVLFPFLTFPYLTRVLSVDSYALVAYVRAAMQYLQLWVDFGFILSATKNIVHAGKDLNLISHIVSDTMLARFLLAVVGAGITAVLCVFIPLLHQNMLFTWLSYGAVFLSCFMVDYLFRGLEKMHAVTLCFVTMKGISTVLTFVFVHADRDLLWIPLLDIISSVVVLGLIYFQLKKYRVSLLLPSLVKAWGYLKESWEYFISGVAAAAFGALNTLLIGIFLPEADIAVWAVALQLILAVQMCYSPIVDGVYPEMMRYKRMKLITKLLLIFMPIIAVGCVICYFAAPFIICLVAGNKYTEAAPIFRLMIPVLFFSFPAMLCGWPALGAIGKVRQTTATVMAAAATQVVGLGLLLVGGMFTLPLIAVMRSVVEGVLMAGRAFLIIKYKKQFN